jgi:DNA repair exonuclease SbcCD ATPase subunit
MEKKYYYGNAISDYGIEHGYVDYATLAKCFDAVLNNDIMQLTYDIGSWEQVNGIVDNTDEIEELEEKRDELEEQNENNPSKIIENEINEINEQIEELESEQDDEPEIYQWYIIDDLGARLLQQETNEIVYYNESLDMHLWGITHYGTAWDYVLTSVAIENEME